MNPPVGASENAIKGIVCMVAGGALITLSDAIMKVFAGRLPAGEILFIRNSFTLLAIGLVAFKIGSIPLLRPKNIRGQAARAGFLVVSAFLFVTGIEHTPLANAIAITFTGPLIITALAMPLLGEQVGWRRWVAVVVGFMGVLVVIRPGTDAFTWGSVLILLGAVGGAMRDIITRRLCATETSLSILLVSSAALAFAGLTTAPFGWKPVSLSDVGLLAVSGLLVASSHYLMIESFRLAEAAVVVPFKYANVIWAILFGYLFWQHVPDKWTFVGVAILVASGLYILERESRLRRRPH